jgi:hypothetical protein
MLCNKFNKDLNNLINYEALKILIKNINEFYKILMASNGEI